MNRVVIGALAGALTVAGLSASVQAGPLEFSFSAQIGAREIEGSFDGSRFNVSGLEDFKLRGLNLRGLLDDLNIGGLGRLGSSLGLFGGHDGFHSVGLLGSLAPELAQGRFEDRFANVQADYDDGLANVDDFYDSGEYEDVLGDAERLVDRYDWFVTGVEKQIDFLGGAIDRSNDRLAYFDDLLSDFQDRDGLSPLRLERIEDWITTIQDGIQFKIDLLTERQTSLTDGLPTYEAFQTEITDYLAEITAAGGTTDGGQVAAGTLAVASSTPLLAVASSGEVAPPAQVANLAAVPEPHAAALALIAGCGIVARRRPAMRLRPER